MELMRERIVGFVRALPAAQRVGIVAALGVLAVALAAFAVWVTTPAYTVLYSDLDSGSVSEVVDELETHGIAYELDNGGSTVLVPRDELYDTRALLAGEGIAGRTSPQGYELLEEQGLSVSEFRQRVDYQRALEGELSRTLSAMRGVDSASVHLVVPEDSLFTEQQQPVTASVVLANSRPLDDAEVEGITFVVASAVEGLELDHITVADNDGQVLHSPGELGGRSTAGSRNLTQTQEFEHALAGEVERLLTAATDGSPASVVVRAALNYDEEELETETFNPESQVALREQTSEERFEGTGTEPGGAVGVDGGPMPETGESNYERDDELREFGVDRTTSRTVAAPGRVDGLSVAIVMDDGSVTGAEVPPVVEVEELVTAALGLDADRGDTVAVSTTAMPAVEEPVEAEEGLDMLGMLPQAIGALVLLVVAIALFLMTRRRDDDDEGDYLPEPVEELPQRYPEQLEREREPALTAPQRSEEELQTEQVKSEVAQLVESQPEEIATLLRGWLADRRGT